MKHRAVLALKLLPRLGRIALAVALLGGSAPLVGGPTAHAAQTWQVLAGAESPDKSIQSLEFYTREITVNVGDTVSWTWNGTEPHTVTFVQPGQAPPNPIGAPATPNNSTYTGTQFVNSGLQAKGAPAFAVTFGAPGVFGYVCLLHPRMLGSVTVQPANAPYPRDQAAYNQLAAQQIQAKLAYGQELKNRGLAVAQSAPQHDQVTAGNGDGTVMVSAFLPQAVTINAGQTVTWTNLDTDAPHTVTFGPKPQNPFAPVGLGRQDLVEDTERLSEGTQEQIAVLTRLGFGRLLADRGLAAPVILDDALVYADDDRIERLFMALRTASAHHQVIVLTCRSRLFEALGGTRLRLEPWAVA